MCHEQTTSHVALDGLQEPGGEALAAEVGVDAERLDGGRGGGVGGVAADEGGGEDARVVALVDAHLGGVADVEDAAEAGDEGRVEVGRVEAGAGEAHDVGRGGGGVACEGRDGGDDAGLERAARLFGRDVSLAFLDACFGWSLASCKCEFGEHRAVFRSAHARKMARGLRWARLGILALLLTMHGALAGGGQYLTEFRVTLIEELRSEDAAVVRNAVVQFLSGLGAGVHAANVTVQAG